MNKVSIELRSWDFVERRVEAKGVEEILALVAHQRQVVLVGILGVANLEIDSENSVSYCHYMCRHCR